MKTTTELEYRLSPRRVLRPGDRFKATKGPYWQCGDGARVGMAERGTFTFSCLLRRGRCAFILGVSRGGFVVLHVEGRRRSKLIPHMVCRPYAIKAKRRAAA